MVVIKFVFQIIPRVQLLSLLLFDGELALRPSSLRLEGAAGLGGPLRIAPIFEMTNSEIENGSRK
jgi:hypothetical protein